MTYELLESPCYVGEPHQKTSIQSLDMDEQSLGAAHSEMEDQDMRGPSE